MRQVLLLVLVCVIFGFTAETQRTPRDETLVEIVKAGQSRHPYQEEYEQMLYPTVRISSPAGTGSGVIFHRTFAKLSVNSYTETAEKEIYILTACHVVENQSTVDIELYDLTVITATVVITDTDKDLALLSFDPTYSLRSVGARGHASLSSHQLTQIYTAHLAPESYTAYLFTPIYTVGCSLGLTPRPSQGIISVIGNDNWEVSSPVLPGNSGGPVYDARTYEVIGIAIWVKVWQGQLVTTMAGIVPINQIYSFLNNK